MPTYKVKENNRIQLGSKKSKDKKIYEAGDRVTLSETEAATMVHALEISDKEAEKLEKKAEK